MGGARVNNVFWSAGTVFIVAAHSKLVGSVFAPSITFAIDSRLKGRALAYGTTLTMMSTTVCNTSFPPHFCALVQQCASSLFAAVSVFCVPLKREWC